MNTVLYSGRLWRHKHTFLGGDEWKECCLELRADGQLIIYNDKRCSRVISRSVNIITVKAGLRIGSEALTYHRAERPPAPFDDATIDAHFMTLPVPIKKNTKTSWFYFKTERDMIGWLRAFAKVIGKEHVFDAIVDEIREKERRLQEELENEGSETPTVVEQYDESHKHSGLSIRGEAYRQKRGEQNFGEIWKKVLDMPPAAHGQRQADPFESTSYVNDAFFPESLPSESASTSDDTQPPDHGYDTLTTQEDSHDTPTPCEVTVQADVHPEQPPSLPTSPLPDTDDDDDWSSGRASNEGDTTKENRDVHRIHNQPTETAD